MDDLVTRLRATRKGLCTENPDDYSAMICVGDALRAADRIEQLEATLRYGIEATSRHGGAADFLREARKVLSQ